jgi:hypothetical protein
LVQCYVPFFVVSDTNHCFLIARGLKGLEVRPVQWLKSLSCVT